jgi:chemotaxis protein MotB
MGEEISVIATSSEIIISMKEKITFRPGEADILENSRPILDKIAGTIQKYPNFLVEINGHTDDTPIKTTLFPSNWELSVSRATSVLKYFIHSHSINPSRLSIKGNADQKPIAPNDTPENRARNRRVEIRLKEIDA